jgi:diketogulonate reductase-like aldo/keto reductase
MPMLGPAWPRMDQAHERGLARSIGVSNFGISELDDVIAAGTIPPVVNQVQFSPLQFRRALLGACRRQKIAVEATAGWAPASTCPTGPSAGLRGAPAAIRAGALRWCLQHDLLVIPKSVYRERIGENAQIFDFALSDEDMAELDALDQTNGAGRARELKWR